MAGIGRITSEAELKTFIEQVVAGIPGQAVGAGIYAGTGSPENVVTAVVGAIYARTDGGIGSTLYIKESGTGNTGWAAK
jgi:hypothetical protein